MLLVPPRREWFPEKFPAPTALMPKPFSDPLLPSPNPPSAEASCFQFKDSTAFLRPPGHVLPTCPSPWLKITVTLRLRLPGHPHPESLPGAREPKSVLHSATSHQQDEASCSPGRELPKCPLPPANNRSWATADSIHICLSQST